MPRLRTDDGPRKLRAVWLGPAGHTLPFQWTYVQWAVTLVAVPLAGAIGTAIVWLLLGDPVWALGVGGLWFAAGGMWLAVRLMRNVTFDEPLRYQRRLLRGEFTRQFSTPVGARQVAVQFTPPPIGYLAPAVRSAMGWTDKSQRPLGPALSQRARTELGTTKRRTGALQPALRKLALALPSVLPVSGAPTDRGPRAAQRGLPCLAASSLTRLRERLARRGWLRR